MDRPPFAARAVLAIALVVLLAHLVVNVVTPYEVHRDELLYLAMGEHLRLWRMDFPPLIALAATAQRALFGDSLLAIRLTPALGGAALVALSAMIARELGGSRRAQAIAAVAVAASPLFLRSGSLFQPVVLDQLAWTVGYWTLARLVRTGDQRWWLALGAAAGFGLLAKFSIAFFAVGVLLALLCTPHRRALATRWPWLALAAMLVIGLPSLVGQLRLGFPVVGQMRDLRAAQLERVTPSAFLGEQLLFGGPATLLALGGLVALVVARRLRPFRVIGLACAWTVVLLLASHGKGYYAGPVYPTLLAAGAVTLDWLPATRAGVAVRWATVALVVLYGAMLVPIGLPILPQRAMAAYAQRIGATPALETNRGVVLRLPQDYADMLGWREEAAAVARVYDSLPPPQRADAVLAADNYGEAGALDYYGPRLGLPSAICGCGSYWFWGPGAKPGRVLVQVGGSRDDLLQFYDTVTAAARLASAWRVPEEQDVTIWVATGPHTTLQRLWPTLAGQN